MSEQHIFEQGRVINSRAIAESSMILVKTFNLDHEDPLNFDSVILAHSFALESNLILLHQIIQEGWSAVGTNTKTQVAHEEASARHYQAAAEYIIKLDSLKNQISVKNLSKNLMLYSNLVNIHILLAQKHSERGFTCSGAERIERSGAINWVNQH